MLSRKNRFHGHNTVRRTYKKGTSYRSANLSMHVSTDSRIKITKLAVVVSKKVHKNAVSRNRVRRRIYEIFRMQLPGVTMPAEIVITVYKPEVRDLPHKELEETIVGLLHKAKLL